jgi:PAS domain S-box-containing protein
MTDMQNTDPQQEKKDAMLGELPAQPASTAQATFSSVTRKGLAVFLDLAPDALIVVDSAGMIVLVNTQVETLFGYAQDELVNLPLEILLPERFRVAHAAQRTQYMHTAHPRPMGVGLNLIGQRKDGSQFPVDISLRPILIEQTLHVIAAIRDMTAQQLAEQERAHIAERLRQVEQEARAEMDARLNVLQLILDQLPCGVFLVRGPQMRLVLANRTANALWGAEWPQGQSQEDFLQQHGLRFFTTDGRPILQADSPIVSTMTSGKSVLHRQMELHRPDGVCLPILLSTIPLEDLHLLPRLPQEIAMVSASKERVVLAVYQDMTALKEAEALKDQFISLATHELRTPVTIVAGYADYLLTRAARKKGHELDEWQREKLQEMKQATWQLAELIEDLLDVTRVQGGQFQLELRPTDLVTLTQQVIKRLQTTTQKHHLSFQTVLPQLWATVDPFRIEQVLSNLLANAIKYSPHGGPIEVTLEKNAQEHEARFRIRDQGLGIPLAQQAHLFERFVRADNVRAAGIRGTGLGLYLCRELIERHGGHIDFESAEGAGSTFFFSLPCAEPYR